MSNLVEVIEHEINELQAAWADALSDGKLQVHEIIRLAGEVTQSFWDVSSAAGASPEERRAAVINAVGVVYDRYIEPIDIQYVPDFFERRWVDPGLKDLCQYLAGRAIDRWVSELKKSEE